MEIKEIKCKTALSSSSLPGLDYSLNPYRGCQHKCAYCYVPNVIKTDRSRWGDFVDVKTNIPVVLSKELKKKKPGIVGISTVTDPYQPVEKKYHLTRYCLEQLLIHDFPICIQTKSNLVIMDIDLISKFSDAEIMISIGTLNDNERKLLEPYSSSIPDRFQVLQKYAETGVKTSIFFGPIYPTVKQQEIHRILDEFSEAGVSEVMIDGFNLKLGIQENIKRSLQQNPYVLETFTENLNNNSYYKKIRNKLIEYGKDKNIKIIDAF